MELTVECKQRPEGINPRALRKSGQIPAALYGHKGAESISLTIDAKAAETLVKKATVNNTLIQVNIPHLRWNGKALLREVQSHPWKPLLYHLSFFSVAAQESLDVVVPLHFVGDAAGVKAGGVLDTVVTELQIRCAPGNIPESIEIDVSNLELGDSLRVSDLVLPEGVTPLIEQNETVVAIATQTATEEPGAEGATE